MFNRQGTRLIGGRIRGRHLSDVPSLTDAASAATATGQVRLCLKDFPFLMLANLNFVLLVEMMIWSSLHPKTIISTSGLCQRAKATTFRSTSRFLSCVDTHSQSTPSDSTPATMCSPLLAKRWSSNCGRPLHSDS